MYHQHTMTTNNTTLRLEAKYFISLQVCVKPEAAQEKGLVLRLNRTMFVHVAEEK